MLNEAWKVVRSKLYTTIQQTNEATTLKQITNELEERAQRITQNIELMAIKLWGNTVIIMKDEPPGPQLSNGG